MAENLYASVEEFKTYLSITDYVDDTLLELAVSAASRSVDEDCGRRFWKDASASARRYVPPYMGPALPIDDCDPGTAPTVALDIDGDGTFAANVTDWFATPVNTTSEAGVAVPYTGLTRVNQDWPATANGRPTVRVTAKWGWPSVPDAVKQATLVLAKDLFTLKDNVFGVAGFGDFGAVRIRANVYVDHLLAPYRKAVLIGG